jgi:hypothetical protein
MNFSKQHFSKSQELLFQLNDYITIILYMELIAKLIRPTLPFVRLRVNCSG